MLKNLSVTRNDIGGEVAQQLATAVLASKTLEFFSQIPIKWLREGKLTELNLRNVGIGVSGALVLADLVKFSAVLTKLDVRYNYFGDEGEKVLRDAAEGREGFQLLLV